MHTILLGTRKGMFVINGQGSDWRIQAHHFAGDPVSQVLVGSRDGAWYAALNLGHFGIKLRKSLDRGDSWREIAAPAFPPKPTEGPLADDTTPWSVQLIWSLAQGGTSQPDRLWAGCLPAGLFCSDDGGDSWQLNTPLWHDPRRRHWMSGGYDHAGIHSILVDPRDAQHTTIAISCGGVWQTYDDGANWVLSADGMKADYLPEESAGDGNLQDPHCMVACAAHPDVLWVQHHCGIFRSADGAKSWRAIPAPKPSGFGFAVACDPANPLRAWFVPAKADACRIPVDGAVVVNRSDDGGLSFKTFGDGLPGRDAYHLAYRHALSVSADGQTLAMASTTGGLWVSGDAGERWHCVTRDLPPVAVVSFCEVAV